MEIKYHNPTVKEMGLNLNRYKNLKPRIRNFETISPETKSYKKLVIALSSKILKLKKKLNLNTHRGNIGKQLSVYR